VLADVVGHELRYVDADPEAWERGIRAALGDYGTTLAFLFGAIRQGWEAPLSDGVQAVTGRAPGSLRAFAERELAPARAAA
jgi:hypothetical protein